jgi:hypothetical protein
MTVRSRWGLGITLLAVLAALTLLLWPRPPASVDVTGRAGPHQVRLWIPEPAVGARGITVELAGPAPVDRLVVAPVMVDMGHAAPPVTATETAPGRYQATDVDFFMAGRWDVAVIVHRPEGPLEVVFPVLVAP